MPRHTVSKLDEYRARMLAAKAAHAGCTIAELIRRSEIQAQATRRAWEIRMDRRSGWPSIARRAAAYCRTWTVLA